MFMQRRNLFILILGILLPLLGQSQTQLLTIEDASYMNPKLFPANLPQLAWIGNTDAFSYQAANALVKGTVKNEKRDTLLKLDDLKFALKGLVDDQIKRFPAISWIDATSFFFTFQNKVIRYDLPSGVARVLNSCDVKAENFDLDRSSFKIAFTRKNNLYIAYRDKEMLVASDPDPAILFGANRVHRNEFGISKGTFWSPNGNMLAFYRMDERMVTDYPLVDIETRIATAVPVKYPMAGMTSHKVTLGVYQPATQKTIYLQTDSIEYLTNVTWSPDEKFIYIACLNRGQNIMNLNKYDATTGQFIKTLFTEKSDKYVEPENGPAFLSNNPNQFIWQSQRDGFNHLYLYDVEGNLLRQLTKGPWEVLDLLGTDQKNSEAYFFCNKDNPLDRMLYSVGMKKGEPMAISHVSGRHNAQISYSGKYILDNYTNISTPRKVVLTDRKDKVLQVLLDAANPLKDYKLGKTTLLTIKNEENTDLYCRLIKPVDFDSTRKYPVIIYVYGGPHSQLVTNSWLGGGDLFLNYLATQGYVVFTLDNRGTNNRGADFEQAIHRRLGVAEMADQMAGVKYLTDQPWVDSTRIGLNGWSYGGFMTISLFLKHPGTFKVAVCGGPVIDWKYYEVMYGERYMDTPETNPDGYENANLLNHVKNLQGKLLIIHDYQDETVVPQNSLSFLKRCVDEGKQVDFFIYPGHEHNVRGKDRVHLNQKMVNYFQDYLK